MINKIFTYGTLQRGLTNSFCIEDVCIKEVKNATIKGSLYEVQGVTYPAALFDGSNNIIHGEMYEIYPSLMKKVLKDCDALEGHPTLYTRKVVKVTDSEGKTHKAYAYNFNLLDSLGPKIEDGSYRNWLEENKEYIEYLEYLRYLYYTKKIRVMDKVEAVDEEINKQK